MHTPDSKFVNLVPNKLRDKSYTGRTPFEVCIFGSEQQWDYLTSAGQEKELPRRTLVAKFGSYGDAFSYAKKLHDSKMYHTVLLRA